MAIQFENLQSKLTVQVCLSMKRVAHSLNSFQHLTLISLTFKPFLKFQMLFRSFTVKY